MDQGSLKLIGNTPLVRLQNIKIPNDVEKNVMAAEEVGINI